MAVKGEVKRGKKRGLTDSRSVINTLEMFVFVAVVSFCGWVDR